MYIWNYMKELYIYAAAKDIFSTTFRSEFFRMHT